VSLRLDRDSDHHPQLFKELEMKDLRDAIKNLLEEISDYPSMDESETYVELCNQYNLYFVEPEDDKEFQEWQEVCFPQ